MEKGKIALVTGGAGFIGSNLCRGLIAREINVICLDNLVSGSEDNITDLINNPNFKFMKMDVQTPLDINVDYIFHLACPASPSPISKISYLKMPIDTLMTNSNGTKNMLDIATKYKIPMLFTSTSEVYGDPLEHPQIETYKGNVSSIGIRSCYDEGKRFSEALCMAYYREKNTPVKIVRIFNTYGPYMRFDDGRVIPNFVMQSIRNEPLTIYGDGTQTRSLCYVDDMVEGLLNVMDADDTIGDVLNIGNPYELTMYELAQRIKKICDSTSDIVFLKDYIKEDPMKRQPDISKISRLLGWKPKTCLNEGLIKTINWFRKTQNHRPLIADKEK